MRVSAFCLHIKSIYDTCGTCFLFLRIILKAVAVCPFSMSGAFILVFLFNVENRRLGCGENKGKMVELTLTFCCFPERVRGWERVDSGCSRSVVASGRIL